MLQAVLEPAPSLGSVALSVPVLTDSPMEEGFLYVPIHESQSVVAVGHICAGTLVSLNFYVQVPLEVLHNSARVDADKLLRLLEGELAPLQLWARVGVGLQISMHVW